MTWYRFTLYNEFLGRSLIHSVNLEYRFKRWMPRFAVNGGYGYYNLPPRRWPNWTDINHRYKSIPFGCSLLLGNYGNFLDLAIGYTVVVKNFKFYDLKDESDSLGLYFGNIGYRFYGPKGYLFRIFYSPFYSKKYGFESFFAGISMGYIFGNRKKNKITF